MRPSNSLLLVEKDVFGSSTLKPFLHVARLHVNTLCMPSYCAEGNDVALMYCSGMPEFLQQCIRAPQNTPWWPKPNNISPGFLLRVLLTRCESNLLQAHFLLYKCRHHASMPTTADTTYNHTRNNTGYLNVPAVRPLVISNNMQGGLLRAGFC